MDAEAPEFVKMDRRWKLIQDLESTESMRDAREDWLTAEEGETTADYNRRLARSILYGAYWDSVERIVSKPFSKPVTIKGEEHLHEQVEAMLEDVDGQGTSFGALLRESFLHAVGYGHGLIYVDYPSTANDPTIQRTPEGDVSIAAQKQLGLRPNARVIHPRDLIWWKTEKDASGTLQLTEIRFRENSFEEDADGLLKLVERIRVTTPTAIEVWEKRKDNAEFQRTEQFMNSIGFIPLVITYTDRRGILTSKPPMESLAWMNLQHWQSSSEQRNVLRIARFALLFQTGVDSEKIDEPLVIGPQRAIRTSSIPAEAGLEYVEHSGAAIQAGADDLKAIEDRMEVLGLQPLTEKSGNTVATGKAIDEANTDTLAQRWIRDEETAAKEVLRIATIWAEGPTAELHEDIAVEIHNDFSVVSRSPAEMGIIQKDRERGDITHKVYIEEAMRRGIYSEDIDVDKMIEDLENEEPPMAKMFPLGAVDPTDPTKKEDDDEKVKDGAPTSTSAIGQ